jgi:hypothetical protein
MPLTHMENRMDDEHSPYWKPEAQTSTLDFLAAVARGVLFAAAIAMFLTLLGCEDFDRRLAEQEFRAKVFNACTPEEGQRIVVIRDKDSIHFTTIDIGPGRYGRTFPHTEIRVATVN